MAAAYPVSESADPAVTMNTTLDYSIVTASNRDSDRIIDFLRRFFFRDEPLNVCVNLLETPKDTCDELEQYCIDSIPDGAKCTIGETNVPRHPREGFLKQKIGEGVTLLAVSPNGNILGVCINGILTREAESSDKDSKNEADECNNPKFRKILKLLSRVSRESNVFKLYSQVDKILDIRVVSVDDACRGHGIAKALFDRTKNLARDLQIPLVRVDCTSHYSAKAVARLGFSCVYTLQYSEHLDSEGEPVFVPEPPHSCVKTFVCPIDLPQ